MIRAYLFSCSNRTGCLLLGRITCDYRDGWCRTRNTGTCLLPLLQTAPKRSYCILEDINRWRYVEWSNAMSKLCMRKDWKGMAVAIHKLAVICVCVCVWRFRKAAKFLPVWTDLQTYNCLNNGCEVKNYIFWRKRHIVSWKPTDVSEEYVCWFLMAYLTFLHNHCHDKQILNKKGWLIECLQKLWWWNNKGSSLLITNSFMTVLHSCTISHPEILFPQDPSHCISHIPFTAFRFSEELRRVWMQLARLMQFVK
jgi:hypothetical protein